MTSNIEGKRSGPIDRFEKVRQRKAKAAIAIERYYGGVTRDQAEARAEEGKEFICKGCRQWFPRESFEYEYQGEVKLASRCDVCREENRKKYRGRR